MVTQSSILAWKIWRMEEPGRLQFTRSQRVGHDWVTSLLLGQIQTLQKEEKKRVYIYSNNYPVIIKKSRPKYYHILVTAERCVCMCVSHSVVSNSLWPYAHNLSDYSVHGFLQAKILEWVAIPFSRGSSWPRDGTQVSGIAGRFFTIWACRGPLREVYLPLIKMRIPLTTFISLYCYLIKKLFYHSVSFLITLFLGRTVNAELLGISNLITRVVHFHCFRISLSNQ